MRADTFAAKASAIAIVLAGAAWPAMAACTREPCSTRGVPLPGTGSIDGGAATYDLLLAIPDGDEGVQPTVGVDYSSRRGNGNLGMGWMLHASESTLHRCPRIVAIDGYATPVVHGDDDPLCLDGTRLMALKGEYGKHDTLYAPEIDRGVTVRQIGALGDPDSRFLVLAENWGRLYVAGAPTAGAEQPQIWYGIIHADATGRAIQHFYEELQPGEIVLRSIRYTGRAEGGEVVTGRRFVRLEYAPRPDVESTFLAGGETLQTHVIERVLAGTVGADETETVEYEYRFLHRASQASGRLLLERVTGCLVDGGEQRCYEPTTIEWLDQAPRFDRPRRLGGTVPGLAIAPAWAPGAAVPALARVTPTGDYDADGRRELLAHGADDVASVWFLDERLAVGRAVAPPPALRFHGVDWPASLGHDLRHVGAAELLADVGGVIATSGWRAGRFVDPETTALPYTGEVRVLDATGDGHDDVLVAHRQAGDYVVDLYPNDGSDERRLRLGARRQVLRVPDRPGMHLVRRVDLGRGPSSVLVRSDAGIEHIVTFDSAPGPNLKVRAYSAAGFGIAPEAREGLFADVNGDGLVDLVHVGAAGTWQVQINTDLGFGEPRDTGAPDPRTTAVARSATVVADFDGDGKDELLIPAEVRAEYCVERPGAALLCGEALAAVEPRMDLGIYRYEGLEFRLDAAGGVSVERRRDLDLVAQAHRTASGDIDGDGYDDVVAPFDRGIANGGFRDRRGELAECPPELGCGPMRMSLVHTLEKGTRDQMLEFAKRVRSKRGESYEWTYYTLADPVRSLYEVPAPGTAARELPPDQYYFRSSMPVVGEVEAKGKRRGRASFGYGGAAYNTEGRGFDGFLWIYTEEPAFGWREVGWFHQRIPYRGMDARSWIERLSDREHDYMAGSPGSRYISSKRTERHCYGPPADRFSREAKCLPSEYPVFTIREGRAPADAAAVTTPPWQPDAFTVDLGARGDAASTPPTTAAAVADAAPQYATRDVFRSHRPEPRGIARLKEAWMQAEAYFARAAVDGARATVVLRTADGDEIRGEDRYILGAAPRLHELRDNREAIAVGNEVCSRASGETAWTCNETSVDYTLREIDWDAITEFTQHEQDCGNAHCLRLDLVTVKTMEVPFKDGPQRAFALDPAAAGHRVELLVQLPEYRPLTMTVVETFNFGREATVVSTYDLDAEVAPFELPAETRQTATGRR
jgi:hypothetical protein